MTWVSYMMVAVPSRQNFFRYVHILRVRLVLESKFNEGLRIVQVVPSLLL